MLLRFMASMGMLVACSPTADDVTGMTCVTTKDCGFDTLICNSESKSCQSPLGEGEFGCGNTSDCALNLRCEIIATGGTCLGEFMQGQGPCDDSSCGVDLTCSPTVDGPVCLAGIGVECFDAADCPAEATCASPAVGEPAVCMVPAEAGIPCGEDDACASGQCEDDRCVLGSGSLCTDSADFCEPGTVCRADATGDTRCQAPGGLLDSCATDDDCDGMTECQEGLCLARRGAVCATNAACADPNVCRPDEAGMGRCVDPGQRGDSCDSSGDCAEGDCDLATMVCPVGEGGSCETEDGCLSDLRCAVGMGEERKCQSPIDGCGQCDSHDDCANSAWCIAGYCEAVIGDSCSTNACCPNGATCRSEDGISPPTCELPSEDPGTYCTDDSACTSWLTCYENECLAPEGGECASTWECAGANLTCMVRECVTRSGLGEVCVDESGNGPYDNACDAGLLCGASFTCIAPLSVPEGGACNRGVECRTGLSCANNVCSY